MNVEVVMASNVVAPSVQNYFQIKIDNSQMKQNISHVRLSFVRSVRAGNGGQKSLISVAKEELVATTDGGGPKGQVIAIALPLATPNEVKEKHSFNTTDGSQRYGSVIAPSYQGRNVFVTYEYELRIWHKASIGSDDLSYMSLPVTVACMTP